MKRFSGVALASLTEVTPHLYSHRNLLPCQAQRAQHILLRRAVLRFGARLTIRVRRVLRRCLAVAVGRRRRAQLPQSFQRLERRQVREAALPQKPQVLRQLRAGSPLGF